MRLWHFLWGFGLATLVVATAGCGSSAEDAGVFAGAGGAAGVEAGVDGRGAEGGAAGQGGAGAGGAAGATFGVADGSGSLGDSACATNSIAPSVVPLDMYIMMDASSSMTESTSAGLTKWAAVTGAMSAFFGDPKSAGIGVGLDYFPVLQAGVPEECTSNGDCGQYGPCQLKACNAPTLEFCQSDADCGSGVACLNLGLCQAEGTPCVNIGGSCSGGPRDRCVQLTGSFCAKRDSCTSGDYATPVVEIAALPGVASTIVASMQQKQPDGLTPTSAALTGAIDHARAYAASQPGHTVVVVLATDGFPTECDPTDIPGVAQIVASGVAGAPSILTFVIGVFAPEDVNAQVNPQANLDAIAKGGGTGSAYVINTSQDVTQAFLQALNKIRSTGAVGCQYTIPTPEAGLVDLNRVNVEIVQSASGNQDIDYVHSMAGCDPTTGGWYYDVDPAAGTGAAPSRIELCDATCTALTNDVGAGVNVLVGCITRVK